jgi:hypothetical protein
MSEELDVLLARAQAAIAESRRLVEINLAWQSKVIDGIERMFHPRFRPSAEKPQYPQPPVDSPPTPNLPRPTD